MYIYVLVAIILVCFLAYMLKKTVQSDVLYVKSNLDDEYYFVKNDNKTSEESAYILSLIKRNIEKIRSHLVRNKSKWPDYVPYIDQMDRNMNSLIISENIDEENHTSYTVNKGEEMVVCLKSRKTHKFHDINLIMYAVIHELAHIACPEYDHTELFKKIFMFLLEVAEDIKVYKYVAYDVNPHEYCGMMLTENLLKR